MTKIFVLKKRQKNQAIVVYDKIKMKHYDIPRSGYNCLVRTYFFPFKGKYFNTAIFLRSLRNLQLHADNIFKYFGFIVAVHGKLNMFKKIYNFPKILVQIFSLHHTREKLIFYYFK